MFCIDWLNDSKFKNKLQYPGKGESPAGYHFGKAMIRQGHISKPSSEHQLRSHFRSIVL